MEFFRQLISQVRDLFQKMTMAQRLSVGALGVSVVVSMLVLILWASRSEWEPLYAKMDAALMADVRAELEAENIPYQIEAGRILVQSGTRDELTLKLLPKGLVPQAVGDKHGEWLFEGDLAESSARFQGKQLETLKRRLAGMIQLMPEVETAQVEFMPPRDPKHLLYEHEIDADKASVNLTLSRQYQKLPQSGVAAIANLVSHALVNVPPHNVSIVANGRYYSMPKDSDDAAMSAKLDELRMKRELELKNKIKSLFSHIPNLSVEVHETLVREEVARKAYDLDPDKVLHYEARTENRDGRTEDEAGEPGATANTFAEIPGGRGSRNTEKEAIVDYQPIQHPETTTETRIPAGARKALTVAAIVPLSEFPGLPIKDGAPDLQSEQAQAALDGTSPALKKIQDSIAAAVGGYLSSDPARAEGLGLYGAVVNAMDFYLAPPVHPGFWSRFQAWLSENGARMFLGLVTLLALLMVYHLIKKAVPTPEPLFVAEEEEPEEADVEEPEPQLDVSQLSVEERKAMFIREKVQQLVSSDPQGAARLIKGWLWHK